LRAAVDRHFFQQVVNREQLLISLSSEVRGIRDVPTLLRTVTDRVGSAMYLSRVAALLPDTTSFVPAYAYAGGDSTPLPFDDPAVSEMKTSLKPTHRVNDLLVPISTGPMEGLAGVLWLGPKRSEEPYSGRDLSLLESVAGQTALALENTRLAATVAEDAANRERLNSELELARTVQERLFPKAAPRVHGLDLAGLCRPAQTVGGDYFDFFTTSSGLTGFAIGDIAGKGISAALLMASLQASLRAIALSGFSNLSDLMAKLNVLLYDASPANRFATFFCCLYEAPIGRLLYSSAGHNPALLLPAKTNQTTWLNTRGNALGLTRKSTYEQAELILNPGDRLVLYTDGVTEARNPAGDEFGEQRLVETVLATQDCTASALAAGVLTSTTTFAATATQHDDITVITAISRSAERI
jgi:sigma-B regulation protein RsbU (phosphoserine phosphatase)